jgi:DnaJ-class molecular chaperone
MDNKTHYDTLDVASCADKKEIRSAFRILALVHHPDMGGNEETFKTLNEAYQVLIDDAARARYDATLRGTGSTSTHTARSPRDSTRRSTPWGSVPHDLWESYFGRPPGPPPGSSSGAGFANGRGPLPNKKVRGGTKGARFYGRPS